ncbi:hypothetical protein VNO77_02001 [Canavalia gladiata]|uniref:Uncharacterized protein n=1 Tax=Canavalia gladiata TaxID=3824 RepID=A0AAN9MSE8_CANGL
MRSRRRKATRSTKENNFEDDAKNSAKGSLKRKGSNKMKNVKDQGRMFGFVKFINVNQTRGVGKDVRSNMDCIHKETNLEVDQLEVGLGLRSMSCLRLQLNGNGLATYSPRSMNELELGGKDGSRTGAQVEGIRNLGSFNVNDLIVAIQD